MKTLLAMRRMLFSNLLKMRSGVLLLILLVSVTQIFDIPNLSITPSCCAFRSLTTRSLLLILTVSFQGMSFPGLPCCFELIFCYHSGYPEHYGLNTQQKEESCLTDLLPSTFAAIPSDRCDSSIPPYLIPMFPTVLTMQKSAYKFDCTNAEAVGMYNQPCLNLNQILVTC